MNAIKNFLSEHDKAFQIIKENTFGNWQQRLMQEKAVELLPLAIKLLREVVA